MQLISKGTHKSTIFKKEIERERERREEKEKDSHQKLLLHFPAWIARFANEYVPEVENFDSKYESGECVAHVRIPVRSVTPPPFLLSACSFYFFFYRPSDWNWVVTSPVGGFSRQIPENPRRDRWPPLPGASREFQSGKRKSGELRSRRRGRGRAGEGENVAERMEVYSISILSRAILSQYRPVYRHHVWSKW